MTAHRPAARRTAAAAVRRFPSRGSDGEALSDASKSRTSRAIDSPRVVLSARGPMRVHSQRLDHVAEVLRLVCLGLAEIDRQIELVVLARHDAGKEDGSRRGIWILVVPDLEAGNMLAKSLSFLAGADAAGIVLGGARSDHPDEPGGFRLTRLASCAVAVMAAAARRKRRDSLRPLRGDNDRRERAMDL